ncbi:MAG: Gfo/Idh/MocA family oxidoreductase [Planctomycetales bacterium]|nr:Gfo/Idh/MocA family oxidoreductase [Planctomycetales bacterium]
MINRRECLALGLGSALAAASRPVWAASPNEKIRLGFIGVGGQGSGLLQRFSSHDDVEVRWLCDADSDRAAAAGQKHPAAEQTQDLRRVIESDDVDAVVIATCNHWHCMAAVMAIQAGKDVYVEKPLSHTVWEGRQVVEAARKHKRMVQLGTQQRSDPMQRELRRFLHDEAALGPLVAVEACRYGIREPIGKRSEPLTPPKTVDYNMWLGPAQDVPIYRDAFHYDWHWVWNTGNGEVGNWGVHIIDDVLNVALHDDCPLPQSVQGGGGRLVWDDAGETSNVHFARFETDKIPVLFGLSNLPATPGGRRSLKRAGVETGYVVYCEGGRYDGWRGGGVAYDNEGKEVRRFRGTGGEQEHPRNFLDAVRSRQRDSLNAEVAIGDTSTNWCHLANLAVRLGQAGHGDVLETDEAGWRGLLGDMTTHLGAYGIGLNDSRICASESLPVAANECRITGPHAAAADALMHREYRAGFEWPAAG